MEKFRQRQMRSIARQTYKNFRARPPVLISRMRTPNIGGREISWRLVQWKRISRRPRRAFFHYGSIGVFQGDLSPLSCRSVLETCVMPVLLYGCENWILTDGLMEKLEKFQAELAKRILQWPKHFSNTAAVTALELPTMRCRVLERKLGFLQRLIDGEAGGPVCD